MSNRQFAFQNWKQEDDLNTLGQTFPGCLDSFHYTKWQRKVQYQTCYR
jgi:hypothetical protein